MSILVNFEDTYGIADIATKYFFDEYMDKAYNEKKYNDVIVRRGLSTGNIFRFRSIPKDVSTIIYVYDMDKQKPSDSLDFLEPDTLKEKIEGLKQKYNDIELKFVPVSFSAETICLHMLRAETMDFSKLFSTENTAHLHAKILRDILASIHTDKNDRVYWSVHGGGKYSFNTKRTRVYMSDLMTLDKVYGIVKSKGFSKTNQCLFEWLIGKKIEDTSKLLNTEQAVELQREYKKDFLNFLQENSETVEVNEQTYRLDVNYKPE